VNETTKWPGHPIFETPRSPGFIEQNIMDHIIRETISHGGTGPVRYEIAQRTWEALTEEPGASGGASEITICGVPVVVHGA
jgi:hypothetical protein